MANYPQLDDCSGVWTLKEVNDAVMGGYWRNAGARAVFAGGVNPGNVNILDYVNIASVGNAVDFGKLSVARKSGSALGNHVRGLFGGSYGPLLASIDYIHFATTGTAADFGDLSLASSDGSGMANSTRGLFHLGYENSAGQVNNIEYLTIASVGNTSDFGDLTSARSTVSQGASSPTRSLVGGGIAPSESNVIDLIEFATIGNATDFGDLTIAKRAVGATSSSTRAVFGGGLDSPAKLDGIEYVTIASQGNAIDYGDLSVARTQLGSTSNNVRGVWGGGRDLSNVIDYITIANGGNAADFGDLTLARLQIIATSQSHGGLNDGYQGTRIAPIPMGGGSGQRGLFGGGEPVNNINQIQINSDGNANDFGNLTSARYDAPGALGNTIRGVWAGGNNGGLVNIIDYVNFASAGNAADFGDTTTTRIGQSPVSNNTRGIWGGGKDPSNSNVIDYVEIATTGNAADFGDLTVSVGEPGARGMNTTRGLMAGGITPSNSDVIGYITTASVGNATDFGDLTVARRRSTGDSSATRSVFAGGITPTSQNVIDYVTTASTGDASDFGDLTNARGFLGAGSNSTVAVFGGGSGSVDIIDKVTIASTGDATDFGDLTGARQGLSGCSNGHGGLSTTDFTQNYASTGGNRGIFTPGANPSNSNVLDYIDISSTGNATDWGDLASYGTTEESSACSSSVKGVVNHDRTGGAGSGANTSTQESIIIASTGNSANFGNITANGENSSKGALSNSVRGITVGGFNSYGSGVSDTFATNDILYFNLASESNTADFGDLRDAGYRYSSCGSSRTRGIMEGGAYYGGSPQTTRVYTEIQYIEISTLGNASDFGDLSAARGYSSMCSSSTRAISAGGNAAPANQGAISATRTDTMEYITIASTGNATDFGDLTVARSGLAATSSSTRGTWGGGRTPTMENTIDYVTIASTGDASDFGDLTETRRALGACSNGHGGLS